MNNDNLPVPVQPVRPQSQDDAVKELMMALFGQNFLTIYRDIGAEQTMTVLRDKARDQANHFKECVECDEFYDGKKVGPLYERLADVLNAAVELGRETDIALAPARAKLKAEQEAELARDEEFLRRVEEQKLADHDGPVIEGEIVKPTLH